MKGYGSFEKISLCLILNLITSENGVVYNIYPFAAQHIENFQLKVLPAY